MVPRTPGYKPKTRHSPGEHTHHLAIYLSIQGQSEANPIIHLSIEIDR